MTKKSVLETIKTVGACFASIILGAIVLANSISQVQTGTNLINNALEGDSFNTKKKK